MRVIKKLYNKDERTLLASRFFDDVIKRIDLPMRFDTLEFSFGYGSTFVDDSIASVGMDMDDPLLDYDERIIKTMIRMELFRAFYRKTSEKQVPRAVEDVMIAREMIRRGYAEDLVYMFYNFMLSHRIKDAKDFLRFNLPWIIFRGHDNYYSDLFLDMAKSRVRKRYEAKAKQLMDALAANLSVSGNLEKATKLYGEINAGH